MQFFDERQQQGLEPNCLPTPPWSVHWKVQDAGEGLAALCWDAVAGTRAQLITHTAEIVQDAKESLQLFDVIQQQGLEPN